MTCPCGASTETRLAMARHLAEAHGVRSVPAMALALKIERSETLTDEDLALVTRAVPGAALPDAAPQTRPEIAQRPTPSPVAPAPEVPMAKCRNCGKAGHYAKTCPEPKKAAPKPPARTGGGSTKPAAAAKPEPAVPRSPLDVMDAAIADLERRLGILRQAREILA